MNRKEVNGALLVNKPAGITSAEVVRRLKREFQLAKVGHSGTLDPMATGLLIILVGKATRLQSELLTLKKSYSGMIKLGYSTSTDDVTGDLVSEGDSSIIPSQSEFDGLRTELLEVFSGKVKQIPPKVSAVKVKGKPAYKRERNGEDFELREKSVEIYQLDLSWKDEGQIAYDVSCSSGFYVRSLARDLGKKVGCLGCLETIQRDSIGEFSLSEATELDQMLELGVEEVLVPMEGLIGYLEQVELNYESCQLLARGDQSSLKTVSLPEGVNSAAIMTPGGELTAIIERKEIRGSDWKVRAVFAQQTSL